MSISNTILLLGGLGFFLFGMTLLGEGLKRVAGSKLEITLAKLTSTTLKGVLLGTLVTAVIQSSSATTVMVVGFVNSGIMKLANATRSRGHKKSDKRKDTQRSCSPRLFDFASVICLRRHDYVALRQNNLVTDESGHLCVEVLKGKGGKRQLQRVPHGFEGFIRSFFSGNPDEFVFTKGEIENKIDLHHLRHVAALREYRYYEQRLENEPEYRNQLIAEIKARWMEYNDRQLDPHEMSGQYVLRGKNRELAKRLGFQFTFDRLAILAVSIFHLSHWRNGVTVRNYILAALADEAMEKGNS